MASPAAGPAASTGELVETGAGDVAPETAPTTTAAASPDVRVSIAAVGDIVMGTTGHLPPDGGASFFADVAPAFEGDIVLGNLEGTLSTASGSKCGPDSTSCFAFQAPPSYSKWLREAGFTVLNLANNHAFDFGAEGQRQTIAALRRRGLRITGRPGQVTIQRVGKARVAIIGFAPYPWAQDLNDIPAAAKLVRAATRKADLVVVTFHGGAEGSDRTHVPQGPETYLGEARGDLRAFAHAVVDAGADLVIGHGPHVLRGMEWYRDRLVAYSLGQLRGLRRLLALGAARHQRRAPGHARGQRRLGRGAARRDRSRRRRSARARPGGGGARPRAGALAPGLRPPRGAGEPDRRVAPAALSAPAGDPARRGGSKRTRAKRIGVEMHVVI